MGTLMGEPPIDYFVACDRSALTILSEMQRRVSTKKPETTKVKLR